MGLSSAGDDCLSSYFLLLVSTWTVGRWFCDGLLGVGTKGAVVPSVPRFPPTVGTGRAGVFPEEKLHIQVR